MLHVSRGDDNDIEALAESVGVLHRVAPLHYEPPINTCPICGTPTSGVLCTPCATR